MVVRRDATELTEKERAFARYYVASGNGTQSAIKAGWSARGASVAASRALARERVRVEVDRLRAVADRVVSSMLVPTVGEPNAALDDNGGDTIRERATADASALLDRATVLATLVRNLAICMGDQPVQVTRVKRRVDGGVRNVTERVFRPDATGANRAAELLIKHLPAPAPTIGSLTDNVDPQVMAVIGGFRKVVEGYAERTKEAAKLKRAATDIDELPEETKKP